MILIGETLNSSISIVRQAIEKENDGVVLSLIKRQRNADYLDLNTSLNKDEAKSMAWLVDLMQKHTRQGIMIDSPNPLVVEPILKEIKDRPIIINSISLYDRHEYIEYSLKYQTGIVALPIGKKMPSSLEERLDNSFNIISLLLEKGVKIENIYLDVLVESLATNKEASNLALDTLAGVKEKYKDIKTIGGLSNISYGLPRRQLLNKCFLSRAISSGLDAGILDLISTDNLDCIYASYALQGKDEYCLDYINYIRSQD